MFKLIPIILILIFATSSFSLPEITPEGNLDMKGGDILNIGDVEGVAGSIIAADCAAEAVPAKTFCYDSGESKWYANPTVATISNGVGLSGPFAEIPSLTPVFETAGIPEGVVPCPSGVENCMAFDTTVGVLYFNPVGDGSNDGWVAAGDGGLLATCDNGAPLVNSVGTTVCGIPQTTDAAALTGVLNAARLPDIAVPGLPLVSGGEGAGVSPHPPYGVPSIRSFFNIEDDFCGFGSTTNNTIAADSWTMQTSGAGTGAFLAAGATNKYCVFELRDTTAASGFTALFKGNGWGGATSIYLQGGETYVARVAIGPTLSVAGDQYDILIGLSNAFNASAFNPGAGVYLLYDADNSTGYPGAASPNWWVITENGGAFATSKNDTGIPVAAVANAAASFITFKFTVNSTTEVTFYVDGNGDGDFVDAAGTDFVVVENTNVPTSSLLIGQAIGRASNSAATQRSLYVDYVQYSNILGAER
jgi:hypothetical protein